MGGDDERTDGVKRAAPEGITVHLGEDAARDARTTERAAARGDSPDPLAGLAKRIAEVQKPELAFDPLVIAAAADLCETDALALEVYRREFMTAGVVIGRWDKWVNAALRKTKRAAKEAEEAREQRQVDERREAAEAKRAAERERRAALRASAATDVKLHHADGDDGNGTNYVMTPGLTTAETTTKRGEIERTVLARFSARIVADVCELATPDATPRRKRLLSVLCEGDSLPFVVEVPSPSWPRGDWLEAMIPARGRTPVDRKLRGHLLDAIGACSSPEDVRRYGFTGWCIEGGRPLYLHAGGAIGADGDVPGVDVAPPAPADRCDLPAVRDGEDAHDAALALVELLSVEPASAIVPMVALAFRAAMGSTRATVHLTGRPGLGKTMLAGLVASLFGPAMFDRAPCSWANDSAPGIFGVAATFGDGLLLIDDLNLAGGNVDNRTKFERVIRAKYDGQGRNLRHVDGAARTDPRPRCAILSTGEVLPKGAACTSRVVSVALDERPAPDLQPLMRRARDGDLARAMASFVRWYAPRYLKHLPELDARDREAARAWGLGEGDRAAGLMGALAHGLEALFTFLAPGGLLSCGVLDAAQLAAHRTRAEMALLVVAAGHNEHVAAEDPATRFCEYMGEAIRSGSAHVVGLIEGNTKAPHAPHLWGYRSESTHDGPVHRPQGRRVGYVGTGAVVTEVLLETGPAFEAASERAKAAGHPLGVDRDALGRALIASKLLARTTPTGKGTIEQRIGGGCKVRVWALRTEALGYRPEGAEAPL